MPDTSRKWVLARHPDGMVRSDDFRLEERPLPEPREGQVVVRVRTLAFEPAMRSWITGRDSYVKGIQVGDTMRGPGVGEVIASRSPHLPEGTMVYGATGWREHAVLDTTGRNAPTAIPPGIPPNLSLSVLGVNGLTAYFGLLDVGALAEGDTVLVSGAAGATGSVAAQIARIKGCRVVGIAGGPEKCAWLLDEARLAGAIDYKSEGLRERVKALCPDGVDVFFDNVGGAILEAGLSRMARRGRIVLCGAISGYNAEAPVPGPRNLALMIPKRLRMEGFIVFDYADRYPEALAELAGWVLGGDIAWREDVHHGFENAPQVFLRLFTGDKKGKLLLAL